MKNINEESDFKVLYRFPPIALLKRFDIKNIDKETIIQNAKKIQNTLSNYGAIVDVTDILVGTRSVRYEIVPQVGVRVKAITSRINELKLALCSCDINIVVPIPGKSAIGIDVAKDEYEIVLIRELIESREFKEMPSLLPCIIGKSDDGRNIIEDLSEMKNLLIVGTTGSGKTMFINSFIIGILYKSRPQDVRMIFINTNYSNLTIYNGIPHLLIPVVTDADKGLGALNWIISEIKERYKKFSDYRVNNLKEYNKYVDRITEEKSENKIYRLPIILVVIDDLSDLMIKYREETQEKILKITELSKEVGIYLLISTQRVLQSNFCTQLIERVSSRIAFSLFSSKDSYAVIDQSGAEDLAGNGDMLLKTPRHQNAMRVQGACISDKEISDVVEFLKIQQLRENF